MGKKKHQKYLQFVNRIKSQNYRNIKIIVDKFNSSIRAYKRFEDLFGAGDEERASEYLQDAGMALYVSYEWALKNYLDRRYSEQYKDGDISEEIYKQKIAVLQRTEMRYLLQEARSLCIPSIGSINIDGEKIVAGAMFVNNKTKHVANTPFPQKYKEALNEIRKFMKTYLDPNAKYEVLEESLYGAEKGWYEILEDTSEFNKAYSYILVMKRADNINMNGLFSLKWDLVIDMDSDSDIDGLARKYTSLTGISPKVLMLDAINSRRRFSVSQIPYWIMGNGTSDVPESVVDSQKWRAAHGRHLMQMLEEFHKEYSKPAKVFIYPINNEKNLGCIVDAFNDVYDSGDDVDFCVLSAESEYTYIDDQNFRISSVSLVDFCSNLESLNDFHGINVQKIKKLIPAENGNKIELDDGFIAELSDSFETVYLNIDLQDEEDSSRCSCIEFYQGKSDISWYGLRENFDVLLPDMKKISEGIDQDMKDRGRLLRRVYYVPGIGGTTLMRRLAWEYRGKYPTFILNRMNEHTARNLQKVYDKTHMQILIFADNNYIDNEEVKELQSDLKKMGFAFVICYFQRKYRGNKKHEGTGVYTLVDDFGNNEARQMKNRLEGFIDNDDKKRLINEQIEKRNVDERLPFVLSMYAFDEEFKGIKPYIANFLENMNEPAKKIMFALSLADYGNVSIDSQFFSEMFNDDNADSFLLEDSPCIYELVRQEEVTGKNVLRVRYHLFGEELLRQMSNGREATEISFIALLDNIISFIDDSRSNKYVVNQDTVNLLRNLFITRIADLNAQKPAFSPLIEKLREESSKASEMYNTSNDAIVRIFNKLVEKYPEEVHFSAHLARYYFYIDKNYKKGFANINNAIELSEVINGRVDPLLYHMKAMGYSSYIINKLKKDILSEFRNDASYDIRNNVETIEENANNASRYFQMVRESNIGVAAHVSEINLCVEIANLAKIIVEESADFNQYLTTNDGQWAMKYVDKAETLWEECKQLASESAYEDLDGIEERVKTLVSSLEDSISVWEDYISKFSNTNCSQARRILARSYEKQAERIKESTQKKDIYVKVVKLMEENMAEESNHVGNIKIWFDAIKHLEVENQEELMQDAVIKLNRWVNLTDSVEAHYFRFVLKFIQAIEGSSLSASELPKLLRELKQKSASKYNRTAVQHWLTKSGKGVNALVSNNRKKRDAFSEEEMASIMMLLTGRISNNYVNDSHAYIVWEGVEIYFNPSATKGEIGRDNIGQRVRFGIGFSYDGPRAYNSSIKLIGKEIIDEPLKKIESGIAVKCEVIKNVLHFVQVKIIGYPSELGSIHIDELMEPYSVNNRPVVGTVIDGKVLNKKFINKIQRDMWQITMDLNDVKDDTSEETAVARAMRLSGIIVE